MKRKRLDGFLIQVDVKTSERLGRVRQKNTAPELIVRKILTELGLRYRLDVRSLPGSPDIANKAHKWAVFVHGCYWHRHRGCPKATTPKRNRAFWEAKFRANVARDARVKGQLRRMGYRVVVIWECETLGGAASATRLRGRLNPG